MLDTPIDYDNLIAIGSMMGSGGMIVMDEDNCMVDIARFFLDFTVDESCGKCTALPHRYPPHAGDPRAHHRGQRRGRRYRKAGGTLAKYIKATALCGLGQTAPNPVLSTLRYFRDEYEAHIYEKRCPAGHCQQAAALHDRSRDKCKGCTLCAKRLPRRRNFRRS